MWKQKLHIRGSEEGHCSSSVLRFGGDRLLAAIDRRRHSVEVWELVQGSEVQRIQFSGVEHVVDTLFAHGGRLLVVALFQHAPERGGRLDFYETEHWTRAASLLLRVPTGINQYSLSNLCLSAGGATLLWGVGDTVYFVDLGGDTAPAVFNKLQNPHRPVTRIISTRRESYLFNSYWLAQAGGSLSGSQWLTWWNARAGRIVKTIELAGRALQVCSFDNMSSRVILTEVDFKTQLFDLETESVVREFLDSGEVVLHPNGVWLACGSVNRLSLWNLQTGEVVLKGLLSGYIDAVEFSESGRLLGACRACDVYVWEYTTQAVVYDEDDWFRAAALYFRALGFFAGDEGATDEEFVEKLRAQYVAVNFRPPPEIVSKLETMAVLALDEERVWWRDAEMVIGPETYRRVLQEWSAISAGAFQPEDIQVWRDESPAEPVQIRFRYGGRDVALTVPWHGDWLQADLLRELNGLMGASPIRFESYYPFDQTLVVMALTAEQKSRLMLEMDWAFADYGGF